MNKHFLLFLLIISSFLVQAQEDEFITQKGIKLEITNNQIGLGFKAYSKLKLGAELSFGLASLNQDFTYDDYMLQLKLCYSVFKTNRSNICGGAVSGLEFVNDPTFNLTTPYVGVYLGYEYNFGKRRRSGLSLEIGYVYGSKTYHKSYAASWGSVEYIGTFENNSLLLGIGYIFYF